MHIQRGLVGPHFKEHEQARVLLVAQHVVLDAARLLAAGLDEGAEQGFERISISGRVLALRIKANCSLMGRYSVMGGESILRQ